MRGCQCDGSGCRVDIVALAFKAVKARFDRLFYVGKRTCVFFICAAMVVARVCACAAPCSWRECETVVVARTCGCGGREGVSVVVVQGLCGCDVVWP